VGHETDVTLAEFAADVRAPTPSVAAELSVPSRDDELARLRALAERLYGAVRGAIRGPRAELEAERRALDAFRPVAYLASERERIGLLLDRATRAATARLELERGRLARIDDRLPLLLQGRLARATAELGRAGGGLAALSPYATLDRGYAIVRTQAGSVVRDASTVRVGDALDVRVARGGLDVRIEGVRDSTA
jgi:exodeoxyribonuclease VII large subunit